MPDHSWEGTLVLSIFYFYIIFQLGSSSWWTLSTEEYGWKQRINAKTNRYGKKVVSIITLINSFSHIFCYKFVYCKYDHCDKFFSQTYIFFIHSVMFFNWKQNIRCTILSDSFKDVCGIKRRWHLGKWCTTNTNTTTNTENSWQLGTCIWAASLEHEAVKCCSGSLALECERRRRRLALEDQGMSQRKVARRHQHTVCREAEEYWSFFLM